MIKQNKVASLVISLFAWTLLGVLLGAAGGYVIYVRQPAEFQSVGLVQLAALTVDTLVDDPITGEAASTGEPNLSGVDLITSRAVLSRAASRGRLGRLTGITGRNPEDVALMIQESENLRVIAGAPGVLGTSYQVQFRGATPRVTQQVVQAILDSTVESVSAVDDSENWSESIRLLTEVRDEIEANITELKVQLGEVPNSTDVVILDGDVLSPEVTRYKRLNVDIGHLQGLRNALEQKLRNVEAMIQNGASKEAILVSLDVPVGPVTVQPETSDSNNGTDAVAEREKQLAERLEVEREIMKAMQPLQQEVDSLLEKFGRAHPTVASKIKKIDELQAKLDQLPPLIGSNTKPSSNASSSSENQLQDQGSEEAKKVLASLRALKSEKQQVEQQLKQLVAELDPLVEEVAAQEKNAAERLRLNQAMEAQNDLLKQTAVRLSGLPKRPSSVQIRAAILRQPSEGVQVAPELRPLLIRGAQIGLVVGLVLVGLLYLTSLASAE